MENGGECFFNGGSEQIRGYEIPHADSNRHYPIMRQEISNQSEPGEKRMTPQNRSTDTSLRSNKKHHQAQQKLTNGPDQTAMSSMDPSLESEAINKDATHEEDKLKRK